MHSVLTMPPTKQFTSSGTSLSAMNERLQLALEGSRQVVFDWDISADRIDFSGNFANCIKHAHFDLKKTWRAGELDVLIHPDDKSRLQTHLRNTLKGRKDSGDTPEQVELRVVAKTWGEHWIGVSGKVVERNDEGRAVRVVGTISDIDDRKREEFLQLGQNRILDMIATGIALETILAEIERLAESRFKHAFCTVHQGECKEDSQPDAGHHCSLHDISASYLLKKEWSIRGNDHQVLGTLTLLAKQDSNKDGKQDELARICCRLAGIAIESRAEEERIRYLAHYDGLTSLPNRFLFQEYLELALSNAKRHRQKFAVLFLDLDKFKEINDTLGHDAGDIALREIASRLRNSLRHTDKVARMGGDEFYVLVEELTDGRYATDVAQKLLAEASRPVEIGGISCELSVSIGIAIYPDNGTHGDALLKNADHAMYRAKESGKNCFRLCTVQGSE